MTYLEYQKTVFNWLMKQHTNNDAFRFNLLIRPRQKYESYYFSVVTNNESFKTSFWNIPVKTGRGGGYLIEVRFFMKNDSFNYCIHFCGPRIRNGQKLQDVAALRLLEILETTITENFGLLRDSPNITDPYYNAKPGQESYNTVDLLLEDLYKDLNKLFPLVSNATEEVRFQFPEFIAGPINETDFLRNYLKMTQRINLFCAELHPENHVLIVVNDDEIERIKKIYNAVVDKVSPVGPEQCPEQITSVSRKYPRNSANSSKALNNSGFRCELEDQENLHTTFTSQFNGQNFVEAHHLVPMKAQDNYKPISLDVPGNIIALCPNCHKLLHLGEREIRIKKITELYQQREQILTDWGIGITKQELINLYFKDDNVNPLVPA